MPRNGTILILVHTETSHPSGASSDSNLTRLESVLRWSASSSRISRKTSYRLRRVRGCLLLPLPLPLVVVLVVVVLLLLDDEAVELPPGSARCRKA